MNIYGGRNLSLTHDRVLILIALTYGLRVSECYHNLYHHLYHNFENYYKYICTVIPIVY